MSFIRCRTVLSRPLASGLPIARTAWIPVRQIQTRVSQKPSRHNPLRQPPQRQPEPILDQEHYTHKVYFEEEVPEIFEPPNVKVKFLVPAIWALTVSTGVYVSLAYLTAKDEMLEVGSSRLVEGNWVPTRKPSSAPYVNRGPPTPTEVASRAWRELDPMSRLSWSLIGFSGAVHLGGLAWRSAWANLWHVPASNRNFTLLTSTFVHSGPLHLAINAYAIYNFLPPTGYSRLFHGDTYHMLSFFLSTGIISGLAQHVASTVFKRHGAWSARIPSGGASGALFALFGAFCMEYPASGVGIILIPYHVEAQYFLPMVMLFDFVGMVRGYPGVRLGHAAHLGGACLGVVYSYFDGHTNVWRPLVDFWKRHLKNKPVA
ncbi:hypothetical protein BU23DRAFT_469085 [Bimuria novae-zelandiae CBS 107.79]|uniref:Peptidase S54 rhomboid domain-containing protein n=1 Tax=Bimuria novae-zelandiae CBS 107.79 TaxID=1447943 RepID=A0A6A5V4H1_9PLEO|nr:hypothetical protein BU23DRAFT_469085 [Bimuria novae-zelandiae CBS 107.79]